MGHPSIWVANLTNLGDILFSSTGLDLNIRISAKMDKNNKKVGQFSKSDKKDSLA